MENYLQETPLLDFSHGAIKALIKNRRWESAPDPVKAVYDFVKDEILFGYNEDDLLPASRVLADGYGQCNTKGILLMALFRALDIPCRMHGFTIYKELQKGALDGLWYKLSPDEIVHSWVEIYWQDQWYNLEGFILDDDYLSSLQSRFGDVGGSFCGYGVATDNFRNPSIQWNNCSTYIQKEGIARDFGVFDDPDSFFSVHQQALKGLKRFIYRNVVRKSMIRNVSRIRKDNLIAKQTENMNQSLSPSV